MKRVERICLYCLKPIRVGRSDKKFCDTGCKDAYYNDIKRVEQGEIGKIDRILKRNRRILKKIFGAGKKSKIVDREVLLKQGFEFGFQTHVAVTNDQSVEIAFCYDYGYRETGNGMYELFQSFKWSQIKDGGILKSINTVL